ncbi:MAG: hypothetical protein AAF703_10705 [Cyanobacteria bacterium P01_D01_bin.105]
MTSFDFKELSLPSVSTASQTLGMQDVGGLMKTHFQAHLQENLARPLNQAHQITLYLVQRLVHQPLKILSEITFTEIDRAFLVWGAISLIIFSLAQFSSLSWTTQSSIDAALTGLGIASTAKLTWRLACSERLSWVVCLWAVLMAGGMIATAYGIFCGIGIILINLCPLWLGLCAFGYLAMALGLGSRSFSAASALHAASIAFLAIHPSHQFLTSGLVMALTLFFFSFVPWDMRESEAEELCGVKPRQ